MRAKWTLLFPTLLLSAVCLSAADAVPVIFRVVVEEGQEIADGTILVLNGPEGTEKTVALEGGDATLVVEPGTWTWRVEDPQVASSLQRVLIDARSRIVELEVQRLAPVKLRIAHPEAAAARVVLRASGADESVCARASGTLTCMAAVGTRTLQLRVAGWEPIDLGRRTIPEEGLELGLVPLPDRGSIAGTVVGSIARLRLMREHEMRRASASGVSEVVPDAQGYFHFSGLAPGTYWIDAESLSGTREQWGPFEVKDEPLVLSNALVLEPAGRLELQVVPPVDPLGLPWKVTLIGVDANTYTESEEIELPSPDEIGRTDSGSLAPGEYIIRVVFEGSGATFGRRVIEVGPEATVIEQMLLEPLRLRGEVKIGDRPASGGMLEVRPLEAEVNISRDGTFETFLPREGLYTFDLVTEGRTIVRTQPVEAEAGVARIEIDASVVEVSGRVTDQDGEYTAAVVTARWGDEVAVTHTEDDGWFAFDVPRGIGRVELRAMTRRPRDGGPRRAAASRRIALDVGRTPILERRLELAALHETTLSISPDAGPARIFFGSGDYWQTEYVAGNETALRFPSDLERLTICLIPTRQGGLECTEQRASQPRINFSPATETGELVLGADGALVPSEVPRYRLYWDGTEVPDELLELWSASFGIENPVAGRVVIPRVASGDVRVCGLEQRNGRTEETTCVSGRVNAEGRTVLEIPTD